MSIGGFILSPFPRLCLSCTNDSDSVAANRKIHEEQTVPVRTPYTDESPLLFAVFTIRQFQYILVSEDRGRLLERNFVLFQIALRFRRVPLENDSADVYLVVLLATHPARPVLLAQN